MGVTSIDRWTGREARFLREALRLSVRDFAAYLGTSPRTVSKWEAAGPDRTPRPEWQRVLDTALRRASDEDRRRFERRVWTAASGAVQPDSLALDDACTATGPADALAGSPIGMVPSAELGRYATVGEVDDLLVRLRDEWHRLVKIDNRFGPRHALRGVLGQLQVIDNLLLTARDSARVAVITVGAQYAESASWLCEDAGDLAAANAWNSRAAAWAHEAGDHLMLIWTLFRRSQQAVPTGNSGAVIGLARAAAREPDQLTTTMRAAITQQIAHGHALDGDESATHHQLDEARQWAATDTTGEARDGHGSFCTDSYIELQRAGAWLTLGQPARAIQLYDTVLPELPAVYRRDRGRALSRLAQAQLAAGQVEPAATTAREALAIARDTGSRRTVTSVTAVARDLAPDRRLPAVAELFDDLAVSSR